MLPLLLSHHSQTSTLSSQATSSSLFYFCYWHIESVPRSLLPPFRCNIFLSFLFLTLALLIVSYSLSGFLIKTPLCHVVTRMAVLLWEWSAIPSDRYTPYMHTDILTLGICTGSAFWLLLLNLSQAGFEQVFGWVGALAALEQISKSTMVTRSWQWFAKGLWHFIHISDLLNPSCSLKHHSLCLFKRIIIFHIYLSLHAYTCTLMYAWECHSTRMEVKGQFVSSSLPPCGFWGSDSSWQVWQ